MRVARSRKAPSASPRSTRRHRLVELGGVADAVVPEAVDELDVELARAAVDEPRTPFAVERRRRALVVLLPERGQGARDVGVVLSGKVDVGATGEDAVRREDLEAGIRRSRRATTIIRRSPACRLLGVGDRRLVAMVPVGDQQLALREEAGQPVAVDPPETRALGLEVGLADGLDERRLAVVEEEDRLELGARRAQQPQPALLRPRVRALVRQDGTGLVRLHAERGDDPTAGRGRPRPARRSPAPPPRPPRSSSRTRTPSASQARNVAPASLLGVGQGEVDDVVRVGGAVGLARLRARARRTAARRASERGARSARSGTAGRRPRLQA